MEFERIEKKMFEKISDIEQEYLRAIEIDCYKTEFDTALINLIKEFNFRGIEILKYLGEYGDKYLFAYWGDYSNNNFILTDKNPMRKMGSQVFIINDELKEVNLTFEDIEELMEFKNRDKFNDTNFRGVALDKIDKESIKQKLQERYEEEKRIEEIKQQEKIKEEEELMAKKISYEKDSELITNHLIIKDKIITESSGSESIELKKQVKEVLGFDYVNGNWTTLGNCEMQLIEKKFDFRFRGKDIDYTMEFNPARLNGEVVDEYKLKNNIYKLKNKQDVSAVMKKNKMPQIFYDFIALKEIKYYDERNSLKIPISITCTNEKARLFIVKFFDVEKEIDWNFAKKYFINGMSVRGDLTYTEMISFFNYFQLDKSYCLGYLRRARTLNQLKRSE